MQIREKQFFQKITEALILTGLDPHYLELEITEIVAIEGEKDTLKCLTKLKDIGVSLSIDDFNTGYSSLAYLKKLPVDII